MTSSLEITKTNYRHKIHHYETKNKFHNQQGQILVAYEVQIQKEWIQKGEGLDM